jgi:hypothetical protein
MVKDSNFFSGDQGGADAGAAGQSMPAYPQPSPASHMNEIADRHDRESDLHSNISNQTAMANMPKRSNEHQQIADQHKLAAGHYRAAANSLGNGADKAAAAPHLKQARACAGQAGELSKCGN